MSEMRPGDAAEQPGVVPAAGGADETGQTPEPADERFDRFNAPGDEPEGAERSFAGVFAILLTALVAGVAIWYKDQPVTTSHFLLLSMLLFGTGAIGVLLRRNAIVMFMCIELMLNAVNLAFVAFSRLHGSMDGQTVVLFVMIVAAAEVTVGLAIIVAIFTRRATANVDDLTELRG